MIYSYKKCDKRRVDTGSVSASTSIDIEQINQGSTEESITEDANIENVLDELNDTEDMS